MQGNRPFITRPGMSCEGITLDIQDDSNRRNEQMKAVCKECGAHCCRYGGAIATDLEVRAIAALGHPNHFKRVADDVLITPWGESGFCPYLEGNKCIIHSVRPLRCRAYPIFQIGTGEIFVAECPLLPYVSTEEVEQYAQLLSQCPSRIVRIAAAHMGQHQETLEMRASRFRNLKPEEAIAVILAQNR
jgi:Fe-S-cluster containining protein